MWVVVYIAPNLRVAMKLKEFFKSEGIMVKFKELDALTEGENNIELMVLEPEIEEANAVLSSALINSY